MLEFEVPLCKDDLTSDRWKKSSWYYVTSICNIDDLPSKVSGKLNCYLFTVCQVLLCKRVRLLIPPLYNVYYFKLTFVYFSLNPLST